LTNEDLPSDENDKSCSDSSDCGGEPVQRRLFSFYLVTSGVDCQDIVKIHNDGNPLPFPSKLLWHGKTYLLSDLLYQRQSLRSYQIIRPLKMTLLFIKPEVHTHLCNPFTLLTEVSHLSFII